MEINMNEQLTSAPHGVIIENREKMSVSGVQDVVSFDDQTVVLNTSMGELTVKGEGLKVNSFTVETGDLTLEGKLFALAYTSSKKKSVMGRLFG